MFEKGTKVAVISLGTTATAVQKAISNCDNAKAVAHYDLRFMKPLDTDLLREIFTNFQEVITIEDGCLIGGFGALIKNFAFDNKYKVNIKSMGIPDKFIEHGTVNELKALLAISHEAILLEIDKMLNLPRLK